MILGVRENDTCEVICVHERVVQEVRDRMLAADEVERLAAVFKVMGDPARIRIIEALFLHELCVCDLAAVLGMTQSAVSHQLRVLRDQRLVKYRKEGKMVFYALDDTHIINLFREGLAHVRHD
ncbi:MAG: ArsR family transcriptional regulator [Desulforudis sp.]|jgi:ArsR family transcriptional regulator|nr:metalloregulator ArsR/SmtB family transcription factor [Clostridia bacterium]MDQ7791305.1 metalloregulator ArsR/SmtB family transcription factor [Clostridia bacterium]RJX19268.1 MAG: ArsR family transcriptional regulator [Desulforudis sp.]